MPVVYLTDRVILRIGGEDARAFLDRIVTCDLDRLGPGQARFGALLTPQGKILGDFILHQVPDATGSILIDAPKACATELVKRFTMYKLRAKVTVADESSTWVALAGWAGAPMPGGALAASPDPRLAALGWRAIVGAGDADALATAGMAAYQDHRITLGVPEGGMDYAFGEAFPHEALLDQLAGVDFDKGCYVGQEVVSRMQHRGTARTRVVPLAYPGGDAAERGVEVRAGDKLIGTTGSGSGARGLAMLRLDRLSEALERGDTLLADDREARAVKPDWVRFPFPGETAAPAA